MPFESIKHIFVQKFCKTQIAQFLGLKHMNYQITFYWVHKFWSNLFHEIKFPYKRFFLKIPWKKIELLRSLFVHFCSYKLYKIRYLNLVPLMLVLILISFVHLNSLSLFSHGYNISEIHTFSILPMNIIHSLLSSKSKDCIIV